MSGETSQSVERRRYLRTYQREWFAARRAAWFAAHGPCVQCGSWDQLELDHADPELKDPKLRVSTAVWSWSKKRREAELAKCQALCHECHKEKTASEWHDRWTGNTQTHSGTGARGTTTGYRRGCRCVDCCRAQSEYRAVYNAKIARRAS